MLVVNRLFFLALEAGAEQKVRVKCHLERAMRLGFQRGFKRLRPLFELMTPCDEIDTLLYWHESSLV